LQLPEKVASFQKNGYSFVHPFDEPLLFHGYGSIGLEILEDLPSVDVVLVGVGGGGLIAGISAAMKQHSPQKNIEIIGVEPVGASKMHDSIEKGEPVALQAISTFVGGLAAPYAGRRAFELVQHYVDRIVLVDDKDVKQAMRLLYSEQKLVVEPAGAACVAALLNARKLDLHLEEKNVVCVLSGGNVSAQDMNSVIAELS